MCNYKDELEKIGNSLYQLNTLADIKLQESKEDNNTLPEPILITNNNVRSNTMSLLFIGLAILFFILFIFNIKSAIYLLLAFVCAIIGFYSKIKKIIDGLKKTKETEVKVPSINYTKVTELFIDVVKDTEGKIVSKWNEESLLLASLLKDNYLNNNLTFAEKDILVDKISNIASFDFYFPSILSKVYSLDKNDDFVVNFNELVDSTKKDIDRSIKNLIQQQENNYLFLEEKE